MGFSVLPKGIGLRFELYQDRKAINEALGRLTSRPKRVKARSSRTVRNFQSGEGWARLVLVEPLSAGDDMDRRQTARLGLGPNLFWKMNIRSARHMAKMHALRRIG
jgi:hypothetical protein